MVWHEAVAKACGAAAIKLCYSLVRVAHPVLFFIFISRWLRVVRQTIIIRPALRLVRARTLHGGEHSQAAPAVALLLSNRATWAQLAHALGGAWDGAVVASARDLFLEKDLGSVGHGVGFELQPHARACCCAWCTWRPDLKCMALRLESEFPPPHFFCKFSDETSMQKIKATEIADPAVLRLSVYNLIC